jgi:hypothetical protein
MSMFMYRKMCHLGSLLLLLLLLWMRLPLLAAASLPPRLLLLLRDGAGFGTCISPSFADPKSPSAIMMVAPTTSAYSVVLDSESIDEIMASIRIPTVIFTPLALARGGLDGSEQVSSTNRQLQDGTAVCF